MPSRHADASVLEMDGATLAVVRLDIVVEFWRKKCKIAAIIIYRKFYKNGSLEDKQINPNPTW